MNENLTELTVGERIQHLLKQHNKSQAEVCREIEISKNAMSNYVNGNRIPDTMTCLKLAKALETTMEWLLTGTEIKYASATITSSSGISANADKLTEDERLLLDNYRDLSEKAKDELLGKSARLAVRKDNKESSALKNSKEDEEYGEDLSIG